MLTHARRLRALELSVIPVPRPRAGTPAGQPGDGKVPAIPWRDYQTRLPTDDEITDWFREPMNIAIVTGAVSNIVVIDVRGDGGFVIAPGSMHASGAEYQCAGDWTKPLSELPHFWPGWLQRPTRTSVQRTPPVFTSTNMTERARRYLAAIPPPDIGAGSDAATLSAACRLVRGFELSAGEAESLLWEWCGGRPGWTREWVARKVVHAERYGTEPIGALR
jgi:hypothetical protein